ncbi:MAG: YdcF family protein [Deltaproteobacteria bacterium]|nr:YdcF family protein [Deltaproteobacteria bacterium]
MNIRTKSKLKSLLAVLGVIIVLGALFFFLSGSILTSLGEFPVRDEIPASSDAVVVLCSGVEYYPRLIEAADLFRKGLATFVVINGNRKTDIVRQLEEKGFKRCCAWYEDALRVLELFGVPGDKVIRVSAEDAYDTMSEAEAVGPVLISKGFSRIILTTSKYHTRRAYHIWHEMFGKKLSICPVSAKSDPYDPHGWWREGRQIRWVLAEYGAWFFYWWKSLKTI